MGGGALLEKQGCLCRRGNPEDVLSFLFIYSYTSLGLAVKGRVVSGIPPWWPVIG